MSTYYMPPETGRLVAQSFQNCRNLGLILDKYPTQTAVRKSEQKGNWLREIRPVSRVDERLAEQVYARWLQTIQALHAIHFDARTDWRMVVGLGGETVLETDLTLHHIYGIPFIPGSAIKGLTRAYVTSEIDGHKSKNIDEDGDVVKRIFGTQKKAGSIIFFDAMPVNADFEISLDIMNPHYPDYYSEQKPPTNDQNPNPIAFLTVTNATFTFALAPRRTEAANNDQDMEWTQVWLQKALHDYGIGGKTSAGYGGLTVLGQKANSAPSQQQQKEIKASSAPPTDPEATIVAGYIHEMGFLSKKDIPGRIQGYYQRWQKLTSNQARITFAQAIIQKARQGLKEKDLANKSWYKELRDFLDKQEP